MENKKPLPLGLQVLIVMLLFVLIIGFYFFDGYIDEKQNYIKENTSNTGVVVEKTHHDGYGRNGHYTKFYITVERSSVTWKGEEISKEETHVINEYETWLEIEVGDIATYNEDKLTSVEHPT